MFTTTTSRIILSIFILASILWLGMSVARLAVGYDVFVPGTIQLKSKLTKPVLLQTIWLYTSLGMWTLISFAVSAVSGLVTILLMRGHYKRYGWLFMSTVLFLIVLPAQGYLIDADLLLWSFFDYQTGMPLAQPQQIVDVFLRRFSNQVIGIVSPLVLLSGITIVLFTTMRPLHNVLAENESR